MHVLVVANGRHHDWLILTMAKLGQFGRRLIHSSMNLVDKIDLVACVNYL
jgi:hypothetical protein